MKCPNCGAEVNSRFCEFCGSEMPGYQNNMNGMPNNRMNNMNGMPNNRMNNMNGMNYNYVYNRVTPPDPLYLRRNQARSRAGIFFVLCIFCILGVVVEIGLWSVQGTVMYLIMTIVFGVLWYNRREETRKLDKELDKRYQEQNR